MPAEQECKHRHGDEQRDVRRDDVPHGEPDKTDQCTHIEEVLSREHQWAARNAGRELQERHNRPREGDGTDEHPDENFTVVDRNEIGGDVLGIESSVPPHEHGGKTDKAVEEGDQLGHSRHCDHSCSPKADARTDKNHANEEGQSDRRLRGARGVKDERRNCGSQSEDHSGDSEGEPGSGRLVLAQAGKAQDEHERRDDVYGCGNHVDVHLSPPLLNILSIRRVTANPPKILIEARRTPQAART